jgi:hypothetical protein
MEIKIEILAIIGLFVIASLFLSYMCGHNSRNEEVQRAKDRLKSAFEHWDSKAGATTFVEGVNSYNLKTFDSGKNWYAVVFDKEWGMKILGEVEDVYPNLLKHLDAMEIITKRIDNGEKFTLTDGLNGKDANLFRDAGISIPS